MKRRFTYFSLLAILATSLTSFAQEVRIKGHADSSYLAEDTAIYLFTYDDFISYKEKQIAVKRLDGNGSFGFTFSTAAALPVFLRIANARAEMIAEPGKTYEVNFLPKDTDAVNTFSLAVPVDLEFMNSGPGELNFLIEDFSERYEAFLEDHAGMIAKKNPAIFGKIDTMKMLAMKKYSSFNNTYLANYIEYSFASLEENISLKGNEENFMRYIKNKPIQLTNPDYMAFFHQFFDDLSENFMSSANSHTEIHRQSFSSLLKYFGRNKFLENDTIREAVVLKALSLTKKYPEHKIGTVLNILEQAAKECKSEHNRRSAENLGKKLARMNVGNPAPGVAFTNDKGKTVSLADYKGRYLYVNFWASWCSSCTQEMMLLPELKKLYGNKITFISISMDKNLEQMKNFLAKNPKLDWNFLYCNDPTKVKQEFNLLAIPAYLLVDPKGNIVKFPAEKPQNAEPVFLRIKKKQP